MPVEHVCPYCGYDIPKNEILFWLQVKSTNRDPIRGRFLKRHGVENSGFFDRKYFYPKWDDVGNSINVTAEDESGYPTCIEESEEKGLTAEDLRANAEQSRGSSSSSSSDGGYWNLGYSDDKQADEDDLAEKRSIPNRACPKCHCELPTRFGVLPTRHIAMFGGRAAGKTAYLVTLFQQAQTQLGANDLGTIILEKESKEFLEPMIEQYQQTGTTQATAADDGLMPIVCRYRNSNSESFVVFYDIAGEATSDLQYMANHQGIKRCEVMLLMIDPNMFVSGAYLESFNNNHDNEDAGNTGDCCKDTVDTFLAQAGGICYEYANKVKAIVAVVTKLDMMIEAESASFSSGDVEIVQDIGRKHANGVNVQILQRVSSDLNRFISKRFHIDLSRKIKEAFNDPEIKINLLGVSTSTRDVSAGGLHFKQDPSAVATKHRIIEPFLVVLLRMGLLKTKEAPKVEVKKKGFFQKLFGKK